MDANDRTGKKFTLVLKTTYKKVFLKYHVNAWFPSMCLASRNAIFGGGRRKTKTKNKHTHTHEKSASPSGIPIRGRDAPIIRDAWPERFLPSFSVGGYGRGYGSRISPENSGLYLVV